MHAIDGDAKAVMGKLVEKLVDGYVKLDNAPGAFMPLVVEKIMDLPGFSAVYSLAHYGELNGDLMADPEMTFGELDGEFYPLSFRNDYLGFYQDVMSCQDVMSYQDGHEPVVDERLQKELTEFAALWLRNIKEQQGV